MQQAVRKDEARFLTRLADTSVGGVGEKLRAGDISVIQCQAQSLFRFVRRLANSIKDVDQDSLQIVLERLGESYVRGSSGFIKVLDEHDDDELCLILFSQLAQLARTAKLFGFEVVSAHYTVLLLPQMFIEMMSDEGRETIVVSEIKTQ